MYRFYRKYIWPVIKVPLSYILIVFGYIFDFFVELPFLIMVVIHNLFEKNTK